MHPDQSGHKVDDLLVVPDVLHCPGDDLAQHPVVHVFSFVVVVLVGWSTGCVLHGPDDRPYSEGVTLMTLYRSRHVGR